MNPSVYWWSPRRDLRTLASQVRRRKLLWARLALTGGTPLTNFGDELSRDIVGHYLGSRPRWAAPADADLFAIGSIIDHALAAGSSPFFWGTGLRGPLDRELPSGFTDGVLAVRGPKTAREMGLTDSVFGDVGLLTRELISTPARVAGSRIFIPHYSTFGNDADLRDARALAARHNLRIVPPTTPPMVMARAIAEAQVVFSSSLHGVIVAHSFGTPSVLLTQSRGSESMFKYEDHYAALGAVPAPVQLAAIAAESSLDGHIDRAHAEIARLSPEVERLLGPLVAAFEQKFR